MTSGRLGKRWGKQRERQALPLHASTRPRGPERLMWVLALTLHSSTVP